MEGIHFEAGGWCDMPGKDMPAHPVDLSTAFILPLQPCCSAASTHPCS
jgi:hypothetical protein